MINSVRCLSSNTKTASIGGRSKVLFPCWIGLNKAKLLLTLAWEFSSKRTQILTLRSTSAKSMPTALSTASAASAGSLAKSTKENLWMASTRDSAVRSTTTSLTPVTSKMGRGQETANEFGSQEKRIKGATTAMRSPIFQMTFIAKGSPSSSTILSTRRGRRRKGSLIWKSSKYSLSRTRHHFLLLSEPPENYFYQNILNHDLCQAKY